VDSKYLFNTIVVKLAKNHKPITIACFKKVGVNKDP